MSERSELVERLRKADEGLANAYSSAADDSRRNDIACERIGLQRAIKIVASVIERDSSSSEVSADAVLKWLARHPELRETFNIVEKIIGHLERAKSSTPTPERDSGAVKALEEIDRWITEYWASGQDAPTNLLAQIRARILSALTASPAREPTEAWLDEFIQHIDFHEALDCETEKRQVRAALKAAARVASPAPEPVAGEWKWVPVKATAAMLTAGAKWTDYQPEDDDGLAPNADMHCAKRVYQAMLSASPTPASGEAVAWADPAELADLERNSYARVWPRNSFPGAVALFAHPPAPSGVLEALTKIKERAASDAALYREGALGASTSLNWIAETADAALATVKGG